MYQDLVEFPEMARRVFGDPGRSRRKTPCCTGPISVKDAQAAVTDAEKNPHHGHEWKVFESVKLPDGKILVPGVLESKSNFIEHPELVAQRIRRYSDIVGNERVVAGTDCGYGTWVGQAAVDLDIVWAKLAALAEGARRAS